MWRSIYEMYNCVFINYDNFIRLLVDKEKTNLIGGLHKENIEEIKIIFEFFFPIFYMFEQNKLSIFMVIPAYYSIKKYLSNYIIRFNFDLVSDLLDVLDTKFKSSFSMFPFIGSFLHPIFKKCC